MIPFYNSVNGGPPEPITALSPIAWYRYGVGITEAATLVSAWADQSGNGNDLVQATGTNQPTLQSDNSILFDGVDNQMEATFTLNQPVTIYVLANQIAHTAGDVLFDGSAALANCSQSVAAGDIGVNAGSASAAVTLAIGSYGVIYVVFNGASSVLGVNNAAPITGNYGANNPGGFSLGANRGLGGPSNIQVKEVIIFPVAHDATERARVITYLATVGGLNI